MKLCPFHLGKVDTLFVVVGEIVSVMGVSSGVNITIIGMIIRLVFWVGVTDLLFVLLVRK